jgi:hypothetical protein
MIADDVSDVDIQEDDVRGIGTQAMIRPSRITIC